MKRMKYLLLVIFILTVWATSAMAQSRQQKKNRKINRQEAPKQTAYYPDFYTFYDPQRGYIYWQDSSWYVSRERPKFMKETRKGKVRVELLHDRTIGTYPEDNAERYMQLYPAQNVTPTTPVPILTITREHK